MHTEALPFDARIYIAGHSGMVGSAIIRRLQAYGYNRILTREHTGLDLVRQSEVNDFFKKERIDAVFLAAARVGGIHANNVYRADFIYDNLMIECNVIRAAFETSVEKLLFLGSSCIYPRKCPQPMKEECLLGGHLEPTNEPYAIAKIAGIKLCESFNRQYGTKYRSVMPTNLYGPNDNFDLESSHVLPAMMRKLHLGKLFQEADWASIRNDEAVFGPIPSDVHHSLPKVKLWGTGVAYREFLHVDDMADACVFVMRLSDDEYANACNDGLVSFLNVGSGIECTIRELADLIRNTVGFEGEIEWDNSKPDGMPKKLLNVSRLTELGWKSKIPLPNGIKTTYDWYKSAPHAGKKTNGNQNG